MRTPEEIREYEQDYVEGAWAKYTEEEYSWWIRLLVQRALARTNDEKKRKDLIDARNYLLMWLAKIE